MDSIKDFALKIKPFFTILLWVLSSLLFFGLGRLSALEKQYSPVSIVRGQVATPLANISEGEKAITTSPTPGVGESSEVIGSKNGTKYYLPWCGALSRVKPENRVVFASAALARAKGYTPAANCKGTK
ncbi:MAG: hypothetical protein NTV02_01750 [Candidatus Zambryskibacteria bacterium]|nr:hypothetical protein [Candidatus Zambryskibacteria bacterium]